MAFKDPPVSPELIERLTKANVMEVFPQEIRDKIKEARLKYFALFEEFKNSLLIIPYFDEVFTQNSEVFFNFLGDSQASRIQNLDPNKRELMTKIIEDIFSLRDMFVDSSMPEFYKTETQNGVKVHQNIEEEGGEQKIPDENNNIADGEQSNAVSNNEEPQESAAGATKVKHVKKKKDKKKHRRGGGKQKDSKSSQEDNGKWTGKKEVESYPKRIVKIDGKFITWPYPPTDEEKLHIDSGDNREHMDKVCKRMEDLCGAIIDILETDFYKSRDHVFNGLADIFAKLAEPDHVSEDNFEKLQAIVEMISQVTTPRQDYSSCGMESSDHSKDKEEESSVIIKDITGLSLEAIAAKLEESSEEESEDEETSCTCDCHGPCPCCCSGCYLLNHQDLVDLNGGELVKIIKKGLGILPEKPKEDEDGVLTGPRIEEIFDDDEDEILNVPTSKSSTSSSYPDKPWYCDAKTDKQSPRENVESVLETDQSMPYTEVADNVTETIRELSCNTVANEHDTAQFKNTAIKDISNNVSTGDELSEAFSQTCIDEHEHGTSGDCTKNESGPIIDQKTHNEDTADKTQNENIVDETQNESVADKSQNENIADKSQNENIVDETQNESVADKSQNENIADKSQNENIADKSQNENIADKSQNENIADKSQNENIADKSQNENDLDNQKENVRKKKKKSKKPKKEFGDLDSFDGSDKCSHCCCHCGCNRHFDIPMPDLHDQEAFALSFLEELKRFSPANRVHVFDMGTIIASESKCNLIKQKVVEIGMPYFLKSLKECKVNFHLYIIELVFKIVMSLACARKFCYRDRGYFPAVSNLLGVIDECKNRDKNQLRGDAAHVLYVSLMGSPRECYEKVAETEAFDNLVSILYEDPNNERDAQSGEDVFMCFMLFTDEWDLFIMKFKTTPMNKLIKRWRPFALEYTVHLPNFIWTLETLRKRLQCLFEALRFGKFNFRLPKTFPPEKLKKNNETACSNPKCLKLNFTDIECKYKKCSKCHLAYYCSKECQLNHWKKHKKWCSKPEWLIEEEKQQDIDKAINNIDFSTKLPKESEMTQLIQEASS